MTLILKRKADGTLAVNHWYADFRAGGSRHVVSLGVPVEGKVPVSLRKSGDRDFERSRGAAQAAHDKLLADSKSKVSEQRLVEKLIELKTGGQRSVRLSTLPDAWAKMPRKRTPSAQYMETGRAIIQRFAGFMQERHPKAQDLSDVTSSHVREFMDLEQGRGVSAYTWNHTLGLLRSTVRHFEPASDAYLKYLGRTPYKIEAPIHREPFSADDIAAIMQAAHDDDLMRPLIVTALCTAMRRGDCALLKWSSVDLPGRFITVKTSKTGETVEIPILPMLHDELVQAASASASVKTGHADGFVWPDAARQYQHNADGLNVRLRAVLHRAGFVDAETAKAVEERQNGERPTLPALPPGDVLQRGLEAIEGTQMIEAKRQRIKEVFTSYMDGQSVKQIASGMQISTGTVSGHLNEIEQAIGAAVIRRPAADLPERVRGMIHASADGNGKGQRLRRGSLRGWHSFRTTFCTLALSSGMPMELVRRVTGHSTVDVVLKHYFRPGREQFRAAMQSAMPKLLTNGESLTPIQRAVEIIQNMTVKTMKTDKVKLMELLSV